MKGIKTILLGIAFALLGLSLATMNFFAIVGGCLCVLIAIIGMVIKD